MTRTSYTSQLILGLSTMAIAFALTLAAASSAQAVQIFGNPPLASGGLGVNDIFSTQWNAAQFTTGATPFRLDSVILRASNDNDGVGGIVVEIYDDSNTGQSGLAGAPLVVLTTFPTLGNSFSDLTFTSTSPFLLDANTTHWIVAKGTLAGNITNGNTRVRTNTNAYTGFAEVLAATTTGLLRTQYFCEDGPGNCQANPIVWTVSPGSPGGSNEMGFVVTGTAVPEPGTIILMGSGILGLIGWRMRTQRTG